MAWEFAFLDALQSARSAAGDWVMPLLSGLGNHGMIWIALTLGLLIPKKTRHTGLVLLAALVFDWVLCNGILKPSVARMRPYEINTAIQLIARKPKDGSFPSGHSAAAFAAVSALFLCRSKWFWPALVIASGIAFSRLYLYMHFPTDVLGGILLGLLCGWLGKHTIALLEKRFAKKTAGDEGV